MKRKNTLNPITIIFRFIGTVVTTGVTIFVLMLLIAKTEEIVSIIFSEPIVGLLGLVAGGTIGFIIGALAVATKVNELQNKLIDTTAHVAQLKLQLKEEKKLSKTLAESVTAYSRREQKKKSKTNAEKIINQIADLSDEEAPEEAENNLQENMASAES